MKTIIARLTAETPSFFKRIIALGVILTAGGTAILGLPSALSSAGLSIVLPEIVNTIGGYMMAGGIIAATIGKLTVSDPDSLPK